MTKRQIELSDQVRRAVEAADMTRAAICRAADPEIDEAVLSRFMAGKVGLSMPTLDALACVLNLNIVAGGKPGRKAGRP